MILMLGPDEEGNEVSILVGPPVDWEPPKVQQLHNTRARNLARIGIGIIGLCFIVPGIIMFVFSFFS